jgi:hypothetical protein
MAQKSLSVERAAQQSRTAPLTARSARKHLVRITSSEWDNEHPSGARLFSLRMLPALRKMDAISQNLLYLFEVPGRK